MQDLSGDDGKKREDYHKIRFCEEQALRDGLEYLWVDSFCLDRMSTEAVNSMFRWCAEATRCYVFLSDVSTYQYDEHAADQDDVLSAFRKSRWFTRGWTLQELIAPRDVEFYTAQWISIGTKMSLATIISEITGIPREVLTHSKRHDEYSVPERMAWASHRRTTRIEDRAYCLMGLFGVNMPLLYGEGENASQRLQKEIMSLTNQISGLRLLVVDSNPLTIETFASKDQPEYAILSHTWGTNEVSFQDILLGKAPDRRGGYQKIKKCCEQAARDGFKYLWVDTCCIDKSSSAELQEAICSMYKWYQNARVCYAYLEDYEPETSPPSQLSSCKWFTRGWTLQELLAPASVKFYDSKWIKFGTKTNLCLQLADITGIDPQVLRGGDPMRQAVAERMSWASGRTTSRIEDAAYSLMGLFNVFMPMLYGEGERAFMRLQEEIMKQSEDYTLFAWNCAEPESHQRGLFARSPTEFKGHVRRVQDISSGNQQFTSQYRTPAEQLHNPATMTSRGMLIGLPLLEKDAMKMGTSKQHGAQARIRRIGRGFGPFRRFQSSNDEPKLKPGTYLALICRIESGGGKKGQILCIWLQKHPEHPQRGIFTRLSPSDVILLPEKRASDFKLHTIYIVPDIVSDSSAFPEERRTGNNWVSLFT
ncbi:heterokaryon incompatibility protein-domain-containing protein [Amylocarpus encephaloides]|uniref:Heterokaryon incompatibility protein-domain-containing protein n=1 Tax=Amylocarpus encephaloides TaxID=45428 RepID=A0A9P7YN29_9HELO|nr:heterokaryon incompatibility protein-domain-containing protein [Amylocarpus encephaloides]